MTGAGHDTWVYLSANPLTWLTLTLAAYQVGLRMHEAAGRSPLVNPVLAAMTMLGGVLLVTGTSYETYFNGAQFVHFLLGPATVALALPLWRQLARLRRAWKALTVALLAGSLTAAASAVGIGLALGASTSTLAALAPKSVTTPIAMGIAERLGGAPTLTAVLVILTGITGAALGTAVLGLAHVRDPRAAGFALGLASHGIGTARALQLGETAAAFAGLAIGLNGLATAVLLPPLWAILLAVLP